MASQDNNPWGTPPKKPKSTGKGGKKPSNVTPINSGGGDLDDLLKRVQEKLSGTGGNSPTDNGANLIPLFVIAALLLWLGSGLYRVNPGEHAVTQQFGAYKSTKITEGLGYHLPAPIESVTILNVNEIRRLNIGFFDNGGNGSRFGSSPTVTSVTDIPQESLMLTSDGNIVDLDIAIQWNINKAEDYLFEIRDVENTMKKVAESAIREIAGQTELQQIITQGRKEFSERVQTIMQRNLDDYRAGVRVRQVLIQDATVHPEVLPSFEDVVAAAQDAETSKNEANIYSNDIIPAARGRGIQMVQEAKAYKESQIAKATGDAERFNNVYSAYLSGKNVTRDRIYLETMEDVIRNANTIIIDQEQGTGGVVPYLPLNQINKGK